MKKRVTFILDVDFEGPDKWWLLALTEEIERRVPPKQLRVKLETPQPKDGV